MKSWLGVAFAILAYLAYTAFPSGVVAETELDQTDRYTLGEIVVTAERGVVESTGTLRRITAEDIQIKDARTLEQALDLLPGLFIRTGADGVPRVDLRGFRSRHVLLLLDGNPFNSTFDTQFDPSFIPTENIADIKVSYDTHSVLYFEGGLGGVITSSPRRGRQAFAAGSQARGARVTVRWAALTCQVPAWRTRLTSFSAEASLIHKAFRSPTTSSPPPRRAGA